MTILSQKKKRSSTLHPSFSRKTRWSTPLDTRAASRPTPNSDDPLNLIEIDFFRPEATFRKNLGRMWHRVGTRARDSRLDREIHRRRHTTPHVAQTSDLECRYLAGARFAEHFCRFACPHPPSQDSEGGFLHLGCALHLSFALHLGLRVFSSKFRDFPSDFSPRRPSIRSNTPLRTRQKKMSWRTAQGRSLRCV